jgi:hypothetical protein
MSADNIQKALEIIRTKVGGKSTKTVFNSSRTALNNSCRLITIEETAENADPNLFEIFKLLTEDIRIELLRKYLVLRKARTKEIVLKLKKIDILNSSTEFSKKQSELTSNVNSAVKLCNILEKNIDSVLVDSKKEKVKKLILICHKTIKYLIGERQKNVQNNLNKIVTKSDTPSSDISQLVQILADNGLLANSKKDIDKAKADVSKKDKKELNPKIKDKIDWINQMIRIIGDGRLPRISDSGKVSITGDYFKLFIKLLNKDIVVDIKYNELMLRVLKDRIFSAASESDEYAIFIKNHHISLSIKKNNPTNESIDRKYEYESPKEKDQLVYLQATNLWIQKYIKSDEDGIIDNIKKQTSLRNSLANYVEQKEREIKNFYASKEFNVGNFKGIQIKPEIRLPLYVKVKLPVTKEDRIKESPIRNIIAGLGGIIGGLLSAIPDTGDAADAQQAKARNMAVVKGMNAIVKGLVTGLGGKQAGRDYTTKVNKIFKKKDSSVKEDMLSIGDATGSSIVNLGAPGQTFQTPNSIATGMDDFALLGPGKSKSKKSKRKKKKKKGKLTKPVISNNTIYSFSDFMKRSKLKKKK